VCAGRRWCYGHGTACSRLRMGSMGMGQVSHSNLCWCQRANLSNLAGRTARTGSLVGLQRLIWSKPRLPEVLAYVLPRDQVSCPTRAKEGGRLGKSSVQLCERFPRTDDPQRSCSPSRTYIVTKCQRRVAGGWKFAWQQCQPAVQHGKQWQTINGRSFDRPPAPLH
jgi:hypothetical protein